jgi:hypothetical protein
LLKGGDRRQFLDFLERKFSARGGSAATLQNILETQKNRQKPLRAPMRYGGTTLPDIQFWDDVP